ncbi:MAG: sodium:proton antiporter [Bacteroidota bacterium]
MPSSLCLLRVLLIVLLLGVGVQPVTAQTAQEDTAEMLQDEPVADPETELGLDPPDAGEVEALQEEAAEGGEDDHGHGADPPVWLVIPFAALLLMIATGPLFYLHHWHHHYPKYAVALGAIVAGYYLFVLHSPIPMVHALEEYIAFIALVGSLFIASSGIFINVNAKGTPLANVALLLIGSVVANFIATTGAAILFIRPFLRLNQGRLRPYHIVFFIFLVANVGGGLTPIGDPPLFLGFLRGVPFFWTLFNVLHIWIPTVIILLGIFYVIDTRNRAVSTAPVVPGAETFSIVGKKNFIFVAVIIASVFIDPSVLSFVPELHVGDLHMPFGIREVIMLSVMFVAYKLGNKEALQKNEFTFEPIREVGWLFLGIFATMQPALSLISSYARANADALSQNAFYWGTGILSGVLDNAPTYLNFLAASMGKFGLDVNDPAAVQQFADGVSPAGPETMIYLGAISVAAVFFGALTYIGNAPNFMVKAICEANGADTPTFGGYVAKYSVPILIPVYAVVWLVFFSGYMF